MHTHTHTRAHTHTHTHSHTHTRACVCTHVSLFVDPITRTPLGASFPPTNRKRTLDINILIYVTFTHGRLPGQNQFAVRAAACAGQPGGVACPWRLARRTQLLPPFPPRGARVVVSRLATDRMLRAGMCCTQAGPGRPGGTRAWRAHAPGRTRGRPPSKCRLRRSFSRSTWCVARPTPAPKWAAGDFCHPAGAGRRPAAGRSRARGNAPRNSIPNPIHSRKIRYSRGISPRISHIDSPRYNSVRAAFHRVHEMYHHRTESISEPCFKRGIWSV